MAILPRKFTPRKFWLLGLGAGLFAVALLFLFDPSVHGFFPPCFFQKLTGLYCPGCGATRACDALVEGKVTKALSFNPLFVSFAPLAAFFIVRSAWVGILENREYKFPGKVSAVLLVFGFLALAFGVLRNLPFSSFEWMRP